MEYRGRRGFTLIELLTVIAIIALLAALLFPVFSRVQENRRVATCLSNMHSLYVASSLYKDDNQGYPNALFAVAERPDGYPWTPGDPGPVTMSAVKHGGLWPNYLKDVEKFHCPNSPERNQQNVVTAAYPPTSPWSTLLPGGVPTFTNGGMTFRDLPSSYDNKPVSFYPYDSYDVTCSVDASGKRVTGVGTAPGYYIVYSKDWTAARAQGKDTHKDLPNQLIYFRSMPADKTVLAWCNYHVVNGGGDKCPTLLASGTARMVDFKLLLQDGFNFANK